MPQPGPFVSGPIVDNQYKISYAIEVIDLSDVVDIILHWTTWIDRGEIYLHSEEV